VRPLPAAGGSGGDNVPGLGEILLDAVLFRAPRPLARDIDRVRPRALEPSYLVTAALEASVEFAKSGTDPAPEDALKNVYA